MSGLGQRVEGGDRVVLALWSKLNLKATLTFIDIEPVDVGAVNGTAMGEVALE